MQRLDSQNVLSTTFYSTESTIDYAHRIAKILARRMNIPVYVGCSLKFPGLLVDEEMQSLTELIKVIMGEWSQRVQL